eukprot:1579484-Rhodomonas_salina.2
MLLTGAARLASHPPSNDCACSREGGRGGREGEREGEREKGGRERQRHAQPHPPSALLLYRPFLIHLSFPPVLAPPRSP